MILRNFMKWMMIFISFFLFSCNDEEQDSVTVKNKITCSVDEFVEPNSTKTNTDPNNNFLITWASGDVIGIFPREGDQEPFEIPADQVGKESATFDGGYWEVKNGLQYNAYYPFDRKNFASADMKTKIPVSYVGQKQNGSSCGIGAFDYTYSDWGIASRGTVHFDFHHIGAIAVFSLPYPETTTYTRMTLSVEENLIPLSGSYDLTAEDVAFVANNDSLSDSIHLELTNCNGVAGEMGIFYMMLPPMDLSSSEVTLFLTNASGKSYAYTFEKALNVKKGKLYRRTGVLKNVDGSTDGWEEEDEEDSTPYLTFTADSAQTLSLTKAVETLEYSVNGGVWRTLGTDTVEFGGSKGKLQLRGKSSIGTAINTSDYANMVFGTAVKVACTGDIRTLVDYENYATANTENARFCRLFEGCTGLTTAPALPATTLAQQCYYSMFYGCTGLTSAPTLPATTLAQSCYSAMFDGCTSLTSAPTLPATTLANECYCSMFSGCTGLTTAPALPATTLAYLCYSNMFRGCTSLTSAPALPAMTLTSDCYNGMFDGCTGLTTAPALPATTLAGGCYRSMFSGCTSLTSAPELSATTLAQQCYYSMFYGCTGLTSAPTLPATTLANYCYSAMFDGCTSLTSAPALPATTLAKYCYDSMFNGCTSLTSAPALPATTLAESCYVYMFSGCTSLTSAPALPAMTLTSDCYNGMFHGCTSLTSAPALPATTLAESCYSGMFSGCTSLTSAPALPATTLAQRCYNNMFYGCTSLTSAPELPATTLAEYCYHSMFNGCTGLTVAPALPATTLAEQCYYYMFSGCSSLTSAPALPATTLAKGCYSYMFNKCTKLNYITMLATDISAQSCLSGWVFNVAYSGTFVKAKMMTSLPTGYSGIPYDWTVKDYGEE